MVVEMARRRARDAGSDDLSATDSENELLSASSSVREDTGEDSSETETDLSGSNGGDGDSSCEEIPISNLIRKKNLKVGAEQKVGGSS